MKKLIVLMTLLTVGASILFYGSDINFQWKYFSWEHFLKMLGMISFILLLPVIALIRKERKRKNITKMEKP